MRETTSASNIFRRKLCPGSHHAEDAIEPGDGSAAADEGKLLHPFACNPKLGRDHLTEEQQRLLASADFGTRDFLTRAGREFFADPFTDKPHWIEERLDLYGPDKERLFGGQSDLAVDFPRAKAVAIQDFKMGRIDVTEAPSNYQLAAYGVMWTDYLSAERAIVAINQPRGSERLTVARYDTRALEAARRELASIYHAAMDKNAPRIAGEQQCHWCRAKLHCEEWRQRFQPLTIPTEKATIATLPNQELTMFALGIKAADRIRSEVMGELTRRIEEGEIDGWELSPNGETREVNDILGAYDVLKDYFQNLGGIDPVRFTECTKLSLTDLAKYVRELTGFTQARSEKLIQELLNPFITRRPKRPTPTLL